MLIKFDTKNVPDLVCLSKPNQAESAASEDFALIDPGTERFVSAFPLSALLGNEKTPEERLPGENP